MAFWQKKAELPTNELGFIRVDEYMRTEDPDIFADIVVGSFAGVDKHPGALPGHSILTAQIGTHPLLPAPPPSYPLVKAAETVAANMKHG